MKKLLYTLILFFILSSHINAQDYFSKRWDAGSTDFYNRIKFSVVQNDTLYYLAFNVCDFTDTTATDCSVVGMMDKDGNILKEVPFGWLDPAGETLPMIVDDDKLLIGDGISYQPDSKVYLLVLDRYTLNSIGQFKYDIGIDVTGTEVSAVVTYGDYYIVSGWGIPIEDNVTGDWCLWIDKNTMALDTITSYPFTKAAAKYEYLYECNDGLLTAYFSGVDLVTLPNSLVVNSRGFLKYDESKNVVFHYLDTFDYSIGFQYLHSALNMKNGNMVYKQKFHPRELPFEIASGNENDILCIGTDGALVWRSHNHGWHHQGKKTFFSMSETADGDILVCGQIRWSFDLEQHYFEFDRFDTIPDPPYEFLNPLENRYKAPFVMKIDGDTGELIWQYAIIEFDEFGNVGPQYLSELYELSDGSLMGAGGYAIQDEDGEFLAYDSWAVRLPPEGCFSQDTMECGLENHVPTATEDIIFIDLMERPLTVYPNPSNGLYFIKDNRQQKSALKLEVYTLQGVLVYTSENFIKNGIDIRSLNGHAFVFKFKDKNHTILSQQIVKI